MSTSRSCVKRCGASPAVDIWLPLPVLTLCCVCISKRTALAAEPAAQQRQHSNVAADITGYIETPYSTALKYVKILLLILNSNENKGKEAAWATYKPTSCIVGQIMYLCSFTSLSSSASMPPRKTRQKGTILEGGLG